MIGCLFSWLDFTINCSLSYSSSSLLDKALRETLDQVLLSGYFDRVPAHQNGVCNEEEEEEEEPASAVAAAAAAAAVAAVAESSEAEEQTVDPGPDRFLYSRYIKLAFFQMLM